MPFYRDFIKIRNYKQWYSRPRLHPVRYSIGGTKMLRNIPSHQVPNKSPEWNRRDSLRPRISVLSVHTSTCAAKPKKPGNKTISGQCTYKCDECPRSFLSQRGLKIHLSVHRKEAQANTNTIFDIFLSLFACTSRAVQALLRPTALY